MDRAILLVMLIGMLMATKVFAGECQQEVTLFLNEPNDKHYLELNRTDIGVGSDICWREIKYDVRNLAKLYWHASRGNPWAIKILIKHTNDLDGGELEDAYIALGESVDIVPTVVLQEFNEHRMTRNQFEQALVMLPLSLSDNEEGEILALKSRKERILSVTDGSLKPQKYLAVKIIDRQIKEIAKESQPPAH